MSEFVQEANKAYSDWQWNKEGEPIGYMLPHIAARAAFIAGALWAVNHSIKESK